MKTGWEITKDGLTHYCHVSGDRLVMGSHGRSTMSDSGGSCSFERVLAGEHQRHLVDDFGEAVLLEVMTAIGGGPEHAADAIAAARRRNEPPPPPALPPMPADSVSHIREYLDTSPKARLIPHLDALAPNAVGMKRCTELTRALQIGKACEIKDWVALQDPTELDGNGASPLNIALIHSADTSLHELLLAGGADPNAPDGNGVYPMEAAIAGQWAHLFPVLKKAGIDATRRLEGGRTYLHIAVERGAGLAFSPLKKLKLDIDAPDDRGRTPLHYAIFGGGTSGLIKLRANPDLLDDQGDSPLALAARAAIAHRLTHFRAQGSARGKPCVFVFQDNQIKVQKGNGKPRKMKFQDEQTIARKHCPPHRWFLHFVDACVWMCKRADLNAETRWGVPVAQLIADIGRPELAKVLAKRQITLPTPRAATPGYEKPLPPFILPEYHAAR